MIIRIILVNLSLLFCVSCFAQEMEINNLTVNSDLSHKSCDFSPDRTDVSLQLDLREFLGVQGKLIFALVTPHNKIYHAEGSFGEVINLKAKHLHDGLHTIVIDVINISGDPFGNFPRLTIKNSRTKNVFLSQLVHMEGDGRQIIIPYFLLHKVPHDIEN